MMRNALITGASRGLGRALARKLAEQEWGLVVDARSRKPLDEMRAELSSRDSGPSGTLNLIAIAGSVTSESHRKKLLTAARELGGLNALVNNASTLGPSPQPSLLDYPLGDLQQVYETNVFAPLALIQTLRPVLTPDACIINITSDAGVEPYAGWGAYGSSKAALEHLSAILAEENPGWHVYWVDPGDMRTQMQQEAFPNEDISDRPLPEESVPGLLALLDGKQPSGRYKARELLPQPGD
jgi:NAD(P)-dependent dehydrogenase (short-subunit alcohol dehydrogenase family)